MKNRSRTAWWEEARFGMFIHWGMFSLHGLGSGLLSWRPMRKKKIAWQRSLMGKFTAENYHPQAWVRLAQRAGMRYMVLTTKHQDGFALWATEASDFNAPNSACGRDLVREYVEACRKYDMPVGLYYPLGDLMDDGYMAKAEKDPKGWQRFVDQVIHQQVRELMTNYGKIDILWYDGAYPYYDRPKMWKAKELSAMVRKLQPDILINNRACFPEDFDTPENVISPTDRPWETCETMSPNWEYILWDNEPRSARYIVSRLVECVAKGGNYLLNVSPKGDGSIPEWQVRRLKTVGDWLRTNGESIYGTERTERGFAHGMATWKPKEKKLYLHVRPGLWYQKMFLSSYQIDIESAYFLKNGKPVRFEKRNGGYLFTGLPKKPIDNLDVVIVIKYRGTPKPLGNSETLTTPWEAFLNL